MSASRVAKPIISQLLSRLRQLPRAYPRLGVLLRVLVWTVTLGYFAFALLLLTLRYAILRQQPVGKVVLVTGLRGDFETGGEETALSVAA